MQKAQGSLEYLVMIAVIIAITTVVTLIAVTYLGNQQGTYSLNNCKSAAAACKASLSANPLDKCTSCDTSCKAGDGTETSTGAVKCCKLGRSDSIYAGATGADCAGCVDNSECTGSAKCCINNQCQAPACTSAADCGTAPTCQSYVCANSNSCPPSQATCVLNNEPDTTVCVPGQYTAPYCYGNEAWKDTKTTYCDGSGVCGKVVTTARTLLVDDCSVACRVCSGGSCREPTDSDECHSGTGTCTWCDLCDSCFVGHGMCSNLCSYV